MPVGLEVARSTLARVVAERDLITLFASDTRHRGVRFEAVADSMLVIEGILTALDIIDEKYCHYIRRIPRTFKLIFIISFFSGSLRVEFLSHNVFPDKIIEGLTTSTTI